MATTSKEKLKQLGKATQETLQKTRDAMQSVKVSFEPQLVNIVGESVSFVPTGLAPSETTIVEFEPYYKPEGISNEDYDVLKKTMKKLFDGTRKAIADPATGEDTDTFVTEALPPCTEKEKHLVLDSLLHRKRVLFQQLYNQGILTPDEMKQKINTMRGPQGTTSLEGKDSLLVRNLLIHLMRLEKFIQYYVEAQQCINIEDFIYGQLQLDLNDERIKELLKQFVFFLLQSSHPLKDYTSVQPTAPAFISRLERNLLKQRFPVFLKSYKDNKFPIPDTIAKVLEATDLDPNALKDQVLQAIDLERKRLLKHLHDTIPSSDKFWTQVGSTDDLIRILDTFIDNQGSADDEIGRLTAEKQNLDGKLKTCEQSRVALQAEKTRFEQRIQELEATLASRADTSAQLAQLREEKARADADFTSREARLQQQIQDCNQQKLDAEAKLVRMQKIAKKYLDELKPLRTQVQQLQTIRDEATRSVADLQRRHTEALGQEQAKTQEREQARQAAQASADKYKADLITNQLKLVESQSALRNEQTKVKARDADIAQLQATLQEKENETTGIRTQLSEKTKDVARLEGDIAQGNARIDELQDEIHSLESNIETEQEQKGALLQQKEDAFAQVQRLENEMAAEKTKLADAIRERDACKEEVKTLQTSASGSQTELGELTRNLALVKSERDAAKAQESILQAELDTLRTSVKDAQEEVTQKATALKTKNVQIGELQGEIETKDGEISGLLQKVEDEKTRANTAESDASAAREEATRLLVESQEKLDAVSRELKGEFDNALGEAKEIFDANLSQEQATRKLLEEAVLSVANNEEPQVKLPGLGDSPARASLETILSRLTTAKPSSPLAALAEQKKEASMQCYFVFLLSFLWKSNFPLAILDSTSDSEYPKEKQMLDIFGSIFSNGPDPGDAKGTKRLGGVNEGLYKKLEGQASQTSIMKEYFRVIQTLGRALEENSGVPLEFTDPRGDPKKKTAEEAKYTSLATQLVTQINTIASLYTGRLSVETPVKPSTYFQDKARLAILSSMNENERREFLESQKPLVSTANPISPEVEKQFDENIRSVIGEEEYEAAKTRTSTPEEKAQVLAELDEILGIPPVSVAQAKPGSSPVDFADYVTKYLKDHQPKLDDSIFARRIVVDGTSIKVGSSGNINYAVLFYCFLVLLRDYLIHIENTGDQCRLPPFLKK